MSGKTLAAGGTVTLASVGGVVTGQIALGPSNHPGAAHWDVDGLAWYSTAARIGKAPIPRIQVWLDQVGNPAKLQAQSYDGSFGSASGSLEMSSGSQLIAVFTGGQAGDVLSFSVSGTVS